MNALFETERLVIRPWTLDDVESAFSIYSDPEVMHFISRDGPVKSLEAQRGWLESSLKRYEEMAGGFGFWAIVEKASEETVGTVMVKPLPGHPDIEVGWHLARRAWGKGYASEAGAWAIRYGLETLGLKRIVAVVDPLNTRSLAVARRIGLQHEGRIHAYDLDLELFSITPDRFQDSNPLSRNWTTGQ